MKQFRARLVKLQKLLAAEAKPAALLLTSAVAPLRNRDTAYPFRQESDFFYFTGSQHRAAALLVRGDKIILTARTLTAHEKVWEGDEENLARLAKDLGAEFHQVPDSRSLVLSKLSDISHLYFSSAPDSLAQKIAHELIERNPGSYSRGPRSFSFASEVTKKLRLYKDAGEIQAIETILTKMASVFEGILADQQYFSTEAELSNYIAYELHAHGLMPSFPTIVASGKNAAALHYTRNGAKLKKNQAVLIDFGGEENLYSGDITRVFPYRGKFEPAVATLYQIVLEGQALALSKLKPGIRFSAINKLVRNFFIRELKKVKLIGSRDDGEKALKTFFPHGLGHSLGLDVHDIGELREKDEAILEPGMVITVEPGLYLSKAMGKFQACGIRIEDNVVITRTGSRVLSSHFPKDISQLESQ